MVFLYFDITFSGTSLFVRSEGLRPELHHHSAAGSRVQGQGEINYLRVFHKQIHGSH